MIEKILTSADLASVPVFPLPNAVLIPGQLMPLHVFEPRYREMTRDVLSGKRLLVIARLRPGFEPDYYGRPPVYEVCGIGRVISDEAYSDGRFDIVVQGAARVRIIEELPATHAYRSVRGELLADDCETNVAALGAWQQELASLWHKLAPYLPEAVRNLNDIAPGELSAGRRADRIGASVLADPDERQQFLEQLDPTERFARLVQRAHELLAALSAAPASDLN